MSELSLEKEELFEINPVVVPEFLTPEECEHLKNYFQISEKESGKLRDSIRRTKTTQEMADAQLIRNSTVCWVEKTEKNAWIYDKVSSLLRDLNERKYRFTIHDLQPIQLAEYSASNQKGGQFYKSHIDICIAGWVHSQRKLSLTVQLSPPESYEGGDLLLFGDKNDMILNQQNFLTNLQQRRQFGAAIIFPSFLEHEVTPVTKGTRHSLVAWMEGPNWK
jgi:PKHD-type hydroxylase